MFKSSPDSKRNALSLINTRKMVLF